MAIQGSTSPQSSLDTAATPAGSVLQGIPEEEEGVYLLNDYDQEGHAQESTAREKPRTSRKKTSLRSRLFPWRCGHRKCESRLWPKSALFCGAVKRPFWILVAILYVEILLSSLGLNTDCIQRPREPLLLRMGQHPLHPRR
jgi:hypothetical protein